MTHGAGGLGPSSGPPADSARSLRSPSRWLAQVALSVWLVTAAAAVRSPSVACLLPGSRAVTAAQARREMETSRKDESMSQGVPKHRQAAWIHQGYLSCQPTLKRCMFQTLFTMNNETVAVWSHVAGLALTWLLRSHHRALPVRCGWERVVLEGYFASCAFLYLASAAYHCLKHHRSFAVYDAALAADLSGIVVVFATCASLLTATALHHASWLLAPALLLILWPSASALHRIWTTRDRASTVPTAHTAALFATGTTILTAAFLLGGQSRLATRLLHCILAFGVGALFYVSRVPERIFPGAFDILGSSHQLWHLCIVLGGWGFYGLCVQTVAAFMPHCAHTGQGPNVDLALLL